MAGMAGEGGLADAARAKWSGVRRERELGNYIFQPRRDYLPTRPPEGIPNVAVC